MTIRAADGSGELPVPSYELFSSTEILGRLAMERMLAGLSTRRYPVGQEPVGQRSDGATATSRSAVSRRFVTMTETALADLLAADLTGLDLVALMVDGVHFAEHLCVVALGIDITGVTHPLALVEGSTENTTLGPRLDGRPARPGAGRHPPDGQRRRVVLVEVDPGRPQARNAVNGHVGQQHLLLVDRIRRGAEDLVRHR